LLAESDGFPQFEERDVVVVAGAVEVLVSDDGRDGPHDRGRLGAGMLVVVAEHHLELGPAQPADAMGRREHVVRVDERAAAVELSVVHEPRHPRVPVDSSHLSAHDPRLLVDHSAICEKFIHTFILLSQLLQSQLKRT